MKMISRRSFVKTATISAVLLSAFNIGIPILAQEQDIVLYLDQEGNATLQGARLEVDTKGNAVINKEKMV